MHCPGREWWDPSLEGLAGELQTNWNRIHGRQEIRMQVWLDRPVWRAPSKPQSWRHYSGALGNSTDPAKDMTSSSWEPPS